MLLFICKGNATLLIISLNFGKAQEYAFDTKINKSIRIFLSARSTGACLILYLQKC